VSRILPQAPPAAKIGPKLYSVQYLRALAASAVVVYHASKALAGHEEQIDLGYGTYGVDVFFVVSGFIMFYTTIDSTITPLVFFLKRLIRIFPLYFILSTLLYAMVAARPSLFNKASPDVAAYLQSILFIPHWNPRLHDLQPILGPGWTLNYEMFFYVVFAIFIGQPRRRALTLVGLLLSGLIATHRFVPNEATALVFWTDPIMAEFLFGMVIGAIATTEFALPDWVRAGSFVAALAALVIGHASGSTLPEPIGVGVPMAILVAVAVLGRPVPIPAAILLIGEASYALYLMHPFAMRAVSILWRALHLTGPVAAAGYVATSLALALAAAIAAHLWFERPVSAWLRTRLARFWLARVPTPRAAV
jgi:exopolysaccharide production protein ExoZ